MDNIDITTIPSFDAHHFLCSFIDAKNSARGYIAFHRGGSVYSCFGATRIWSYETAEEALADVLSLSKTMSYKNALAGTSYGGAKAVIITDAVNLRKREQIIRNYVKYINMLSGNFITGADVGVSLNEVLLMSRLSSYIVGVKNNPVQYTASGLYHCLKVCLNEIFDSESLEGRSFAIQGLGKTGVAFLQKIYKQAAKIYVSDISQAKVNAVLRSYSKVIPVSLSEIVSRNVDVFCPCALGGTLNNSTIVQLHCKIILGSANCQLSDKESGRIIHRLGILYAPDYVVNAGGLISVVDEYEHSRVSKIRVEKRVATIANTLQIIINNSKKTGKPISDVADSIAEERIKKIV